jgi:hypothetical protein
LLRIFPIHKQNICLELAI